MNSDALFAHIASQTRGNLELLIAQNQLSRGDCQPLLDRLSSIENISRITAQAQNIAITPSRVSSPPQSSPMQNTEAYRRASSRFSIPRPPATPQLLYRVRALWGYNEHNQDMNDLMFHPGDVIEVLKETNGDWWEGRCNGRVGLFPSNYVEKINSPDFPAPSMTLNYHPPPYPQPGPSPYAPPPLAYPNSPASMVNSPPMPAALNDNKPKRHYFNGDLGNTLTHSAVGGVGFGAGNGLGNSIF